MDLIFKHHETVVMNIEKHLNNRPLRVNIH